MKKIPLKKQQGVVLIWALAILLVLTIIGLNSVKKANMGTKVAGNSLATMMVFQGAESALGAASNNNIINLASRIPAGQRLPIPQNILPNEAVSGGSISSTGNVMLMEKGDCPVTNSAISSSLRCQIYRIEVESRLQGTGARTEHVQGVAVIEAPGNSYNN